MALDSGPVPGGAGEPGGGLSGGRMDWPEAVCDPLAGCTCLWQDLDGLHVAPAPPQAPPTSILWGWRGQSRLVRVRLDGDTAYVAVLDVVADGETAAGPPAGARLVHTVPWAPDDDRVAGARAAATSGRGPAPGSGGVGASYEQVTVDSVEAGPITFVRPVSRG